MVLLVHRIKPYTVEAEGMIERRSYTFTGSTENRHKLVAGTQRNKTLTCTHTKRERHTHAQANGLRLELT